MSCDEIGTKLEAYLDGELTLSDRRFVESHLEYCPGCGEILSQHKLLQECLQDSSLVMPVPRTLKKSIQSQLKQLTDETPAAGSHWFAWMSFSGGISALIAVVTWLFLTVNVVPESYLSVEEQILSAHVSSLMVDHLTDIKSTDKHTVKPWFNGRLNHSPTVRKIKDKDLRLIGGRLEYINNQSASAVVYKKRAHVINVFALRDDSQVESGFKEKSRYSYNIISWQSAGLQYWIVSDLNSKELNDFAHRYAQR